MNLYKCPTETCPNAIEPTYFEEAETSVFCPLCQSYAATKFVEIETPAPAPTKAKK